MKKTATTLALVLGVALPTWAVAEVTASGEVYLGYGDSDGTDGGEDGSAFLYGDVNVKGDFGQEGAVKYGFSLDIDVGIDDSDSPETSADLDDLTVYLDFGSAGKLSYTTEGRCFAGAVPWLDGDLVGDKIDPRGHGDSVHTRIGGKARCVGYSPAVIDGVVKGVKTDGYFKYENKFGDLKTNFYFDPTQKAEGFGSEDVLTGGIPQWEIEVDYKLGPVIARASYTEMDDYTLWLIAPMPKQGLFSFIRYEHQDTTSDNDYRWTLFTQWRAKNMGVFKGGMFIFQTDDSDEKTGYVVQANFGDKNWDASIALDKDGDYAIEGSYSVNDNVKIVAGYDGGCEAGDCFNANNGFGGAAAQGSTWELGVKMTF